MTRAQKIEILYRKAHGDSIYLSPDEQSELKKYRVSDYDSEWATKANIRDYVNAVDNGCRLGFLDWCQNNCRGDRRRKGHSREDIAANNRALTVSAVCIGWLLWGMAIYWLSPVKLTVGGSAVLGAVLSIILVRVNRRWAGFTLLILPILLLSIFAG